MLAAVLIPDKLTLANNMQLIHEVRIIVSFVTHSCLQQARSW